VKPVDIFIFSLYKVLAEISWYCERNCFLNVMKG